MQTRVERTYVTDDGRTFKRKADACRHDAELYVTKRGYTPEQFDRMFEQVRNRTKAWNLGDWRDSYKVGANNGVFLLDDIIDTYEGMKHAHLIVFDCEGWKVIHDQTIDMLADGNRVEQAAKAAEERFSDESYECRTPTEDELNRLLRSATGMRRSLSYTTLLVRKLRPMSVTQKLERGIQLTDDELEGFVLYGNEVYRDNGEIGRWSRHVSSVIADDNGQLWCVEWEEGLTEMQDDGFYEQPYKVHLDKKPVTIIQTTIVRDE